MERSRGWMLFAALGLMVVGHGCHCNADEHTDAGDVGDSGVPTDAGISNETPDSGMVGVLQHHRNASRDGVYVDAALKPATVPNLVVDTGFHATTDSQTYGQPLFLEKGVNGKDALFVATENNNVYALDALTGAQLWKVNVGEPVTTGLPCGDVSPLGILSTPVLDPTSRRLYVAAMVKGAGNKPTHIVAAIDIDAHTTLWTEDVAASVSGFTSNVQNQRSALLLLDDVVYVPYAGLDGDCGNYQGWVIAVPVKDPSNHHATGWRTAAYSGSGIWAPSGAASDGQSIFIATGNTNDRSGEGHPFPTVWTDAHSEAVLKLSPPTPTFSGNSTDFFTMNLSGGHDWYGNDKADADLGSTGVVLFDVPGATPGHLGFAIGKTARTFLVNRDDLGGLSAGVGNNLTANGMAFGSLIAYHSPTSAYVGGRFTITGASCSVGGADFSVLKVSATAPPQLSFAWCARSGGKTSAIVSTTDGTHEPIVWTYGSASDETLRAHDGDSGATLFTSSALPGSSQWNSPIIAKGRVYVAGNGTVTALALP